MAPTASIAPTSPYSADHTGPGSALTAGAYDIIGGVSWTDNWRYVITNGLGSVFA